MRRDRRGLPPLDRAASRAHARPVPVGAPTRTAPYTPRTGPFDRPFASLPARPRPGEFTRPRRTRETHARTGGARQVRDTAPAGPSVAVRETADGAHRPSWGPDPVRHTSVDTATQRPTATQGDVPRDREETARIAENCQLAGRLRRWWQVLGSNQRRLSRRLYRPPCTDMTICLLTCEYVASGDLRGTLCPSYVRARRGRRG